MMRTSDLIDILLIEDDAMDAEIVQRGFRDSTINAKIDWVRTLQTGIDRLNERNFDVVLLDLTLPDCVGGETVTTLRRYAPNVPIVVLTGSDDPCLGAQLIDLGANEYLVKGETSKSVLARAITNSISRYENDARVRELLGEVKAQSQSLKAKNAKLAKLYSQAHEFVDNVSHEFRTPLTVVKEYISLVREGLAGPITEKQSRLLSIAEDRANDLNTMVDDMLDISKLEAGMLGGWRKECALSDVTQHVRDSLVSKASVKNVTLQWMVPDDLPMIYCDAEKAGRVITNLAVNAIKFCGRPGLVQISARADYENKEILVWVTDNGPGIESEALAEIFQRFKQLGQSIRSSTKGFGLGLNIAKELVALNFGSIDVESEPGCGSIFSFTIPFAEPTEIAKRYADRLVNLRALDGQEYPEVSLVKVTLLKDTDPGLANEFDAFVNYCLRRDDVLFRLSDYQWLIAMPETYNDVCTFITRVHQERSSVNRNRPFGPLPEADLNIMGTWSIVPSRSEFLSAVAAMVQSEALQHA